MKQSADSLRCAADRVHAIIPVFNRVEATLGCIEFLKRQTHANLRIIVADGGSTDGTPDIVSRNHKDVVVLTSVRPQFWGGAMRMGMDRVLADGAGDEEFILMVNNDTQFGPDNLHYLIETSRKHNAAVGSVVVDIDNPDEVIDGGVTLDWSTYRFHTVKSIPPNVAAKLDCDVLPGRCTLVPVSAVRCAGAVDSESFPHYIADYEFSHRLKREAGVILAVDYRARVATRVDLFRVRGGSMPFSRILSRRSKSNLVDHVRFIRRHAPEHARQMLIRRLVFTHSSFLWRPLRPVYRFGSGVVQLIAMPFGPFFGLPVREQEGSLSAAARLKLRMFRARLGRFVREPYLVDEQDSARFGLKAKDLQKKNILSPSGFQGYWSFQIPESEISGQPENVQLLHRYASSLGFKLRRYFEVRMNSDPGA